MAVAYRSSNSQGFNGDPWSYTSPPSGTAENDILIAWIDLDTVGVTIDSVPSGWTQIDTADSVGGDLRSYLFWKRAGAGEAGPYSWGLTAAEDGMISMASYTGCVTTGDPQDVAGDVQGNAGAATQTSGTIVTTTDNCKIVGFTGADESATLTPYWSSWTNSAVERQDVEEATFFVEHGIADYTKTPAGSTSLTVTPADASEGITFGIVALKPAAGAADATYNPPIGILGAIGW